MLLSRCGFECGIGLCRVLAITGQQQTEIVLSLLVAGLRGDPPPAQRAGGVIGCGLIGEHPECVGGAAVTVLSSLLERATRGTEITVKLPGDDQLGLREQCVTVTLRDGARQAVGDCGGDGGHDWSTDCGQ